MKSRSKALSFSLQLLIGCYVIVLAFSIALLSISAAYGKVLIGILTVIILAGLTYPYYLFLEQKWTSRVKHLAEVAKNAANGDLTARAEIHSNDAYGEFAQAFNDMLDRFSSIMTETSKLYENVSETGRDLYEKNANLKEVLFQVSTSTNELATGANQISTDVADISGSLKEIETMITSLANFTQLMNDRSENTLKLIEQGRMAVERQVEGIKSNADATQNVALTFNELVKSVSGISKITRTISEIAEQTNLLSLNASIEAARAGEHGMGFAVVAQEVRKLADASAKSVKEVIQLVRSIEQDLRLTIENMNRNEAIVTEQEHLIRETAAVFEQIVESTNFVADHIHNIAKESRHMLEQARRIASAMENISAITQQSAAGTEQVSASMAEQIAAAEEMLAQTERMSASVRDLHQKIQSLRF
jgi:methyl-accepting chemotaxis protein